MKKRTLNQTWTLCLRMWRSIAKKWENEEDDVDELKYQWLAENGFGRNIIYNSCFFCDCGSDDCSTCPGRLVNRSFSCMDDRYNFEEKPVEFYAELLRLNRIRKEKLCKNIKSKSKKR